ncbi:MAG TPA: alpha/beta hydrolase [Caulobacteraceae bacterium]|nr:alpha/beta hydrolase [Caulobacteraceae bacterium]
MRTPIVMVHGAFCAGWAFDGFRAPFEAAGHPVIAPDLPGHAGAGGSAVAGLSMGDYARAVCRIIEAQGAPPILIGHSLGGLVAQMAASRRPVAALILLAPSAPWGVTGSTAEEAISAVSLYALGPYWALAVDPDYPAARRYLFDRLPRAAWRATFARLVPESGRALWETLNWWLDPFATTLVGTDAVSAPVLAIAGGLDAIHPAATVRATARRLGGETRVFPEMSHWLVGEPGWEEVADACLGWISAREGGARDAA